MRWRRKSEELNTEELNTPELSKRERQPIPADGLSYVLDHSITYGVFPADQSDAVWIHEERRAGDGRRLLSSLVKVELDSIPFVVECLQRYLPDVKQ